MFCPQSHAGGAQSTRLIGGLFGSIHFAPARLGTYELDEVVRAERSVETLGLVSVFLTGHYF
jgi:hypothetical protein